MKKLARAVGVSLRSIGAKLPVRTAIDKLGALFDDRAVEWNDEALTNQAIAKAKLQREGKQAT
jgi:hypothetical protein